MPVYKRNNLIVTLTIAIVLIVSGTVYLIVAFNAPKKAEKGFFLAFAADRGEDLWFSVDTYEKMRTYTSYHLNSDSLYNLLTLQKAKEHINLLKEKKDTLNGVHVILSDKTPYYFFIKAVECFYEKKPHSFAPNANDIYAWYVNVAPKPKDNRLSYE